MYMTFLYVVYLHGQLNFPLTWRGQRQLFFSMTPETLAWENCSALPITSVVFTRDVLLQRK